MDFLHDLWRIPLTSLLSLVLLFAMCKWIGQRQISQMTMFDYINSITIGSIAAELATALEHWWRPCLATIIYGAAVVTINRLCCRSLKTRTFFNGRPLILLEHGGLRRDNLKKAGLDINEFLTQCRIAGYFDLSQLETALLETSGSMSFLPKSEQRPVTPQDMELSVPAESLCINIILDGKVLEENLKHMGKNQKWLNQQLHAAGIPLNQVMLATCDYQGKFNAYPMRNRANHDGPNEQ